MKRIASILLISFGFAFAANAQSTELIMKTSMGNMTIMLYDDTPLHKDNFLTLVNEKFFDDLIFHRVIENFMIQAGNPQTRNHKEGERYGDDSKGSTIPAEFRPHHIHKKGALSAARRGPGNPNKESSGSQFYIVQGEKMDDNKLSLHQSRRSKPLTEKDVEIYKESGGYPMLDYEYTVFGEVIDGFEVIDKIAAVKVVDAKRRDHRPVKDVKIISVRVKKKK